VSALVEVAGRLEALLAARLGVPPAESGVVPGVPLGGDEQALAAVRAAAGGSIGDLELAPLDASLDGVARSARLGDAERYVLAAAVLVGLDDRIGRAVGLLHDDVSRTRPSLGLLARLLDGLVPRAGVLQAAGPGGPLEHRGLADLAGAYGDADAPVSAREVVLHPRVLAALLRAAPLDLPDPAWLGVLSLEDTGPRDEGPPGPGAETVRRLAGAPGGGGVVGLLRVGADVESALDPARAFARAAGVRLLRVDLAAALARGSAPEAVLRAVRRESVLTSALPVWTRLPGGDALADAELPRRLAHLFLAAPAPLVVHAEHAWTPPADLPLVLVQQPCPAPGYRERQALWEREQGDAPAAPPDTARTLATTFVLPRNAVSAARADAAAAAAVLGGDPREHLHRAAHRQAASRLVRFATRVTPRAGWEDLVTPPSVLRQLREVEWRAAHRVRVFEESGFTRGRRGFLALFAGGSGTGKTLAAEVIAGTHGFDLYQVDLAALVSKYIGETEKNLSQVFDDAESTHAILFFDEADALFGKRSEVKDAQDRYANQEINYLLQRVEAYDGVVILATNLRQNMDEAFLRRLDLVIDMPFPDETARAEIWRRTWPPGVELAPEVDPEDLARRFRLSGGSIRNCAVDAAFRAVARDDAGGRLRITSPDVLLAVGREYQKLGRPVTRAEFGEGYGIVMDTLFTGAAGAVSGGRDEA
jgi:DNA-binding transcriptional regulator YdaS (Cro superfamily)